MQGNIGLIAHDPGVVTGRNVKYLASTHFDYIAVTHGRGCAARNDHADMFDKASFLSQRLANVFGPTPSRFVSGSADGHAAQGDELEPALAEFAHLVGLVEAAEHRLQASVAIRKFASRTSSAIPAISWADEG